jgi:hypothetical protein
MKKIKWKEIKSQNLYEGIVDGKVAFSIEGLLCLTDLRESRESKTYIAPKHYSITSKENAKQIAFDLVNNLNVDIHKENYESLLKKDIERSSRIKKLTEDAEKLIGRKLI